MRYKLCTAPALLASALLAACGGPTSADPSFLSAAVEGDVNVEYQGSGNFHVAPTGTPGAVRFILHSRGSGASAGEGFWFHSTRLPAPGERTLGIMDAGTDGATYWRDEGSERRIFAAQAGTLELGEVTARRVSGSFRMTARLVQVCAIEPGVPAPIVTCRPASEDMSVEVTGSFQAGPLGGDVAGLAPAPS